MPVAPHGSSAQEAPPLARLPLAAALAVFVPIALAWPLRALVAKFDPPLYRAEPMLPFLLITVLNYLVIWIGWRMLRERGVTLPMLGVRRPRPRDFALAAGAAVLLILAVYPLATMLIQALGFERPRNLAISPDSVTDIVGAVLLLGLLIPLAEELLFRGFLLNLLRERLGSAVLAGIVGALAFAAVHVPRMGLGGALFILLWATVPIALFFVTRNVFATTAAHAVNNLFAYLIVPLLIIRHSA